MTDPAVEMVKIVQQLIEKEMKKREVPGIMTGQVMTPPPNLTVKVAPRLTIQAKNIMVSQHVQSGYWRNFIIEKSGEVSPAAGQKKKSELSFTADDTTDGTLSGEVNGNKTGILYGNPGGVPPIVPMEAPFVGPLTGVASPPSATTVTTFTVDDPQHNHMQKEVTLEKTNFLAEGAIKLVDTLKKDDLVIMIPATDKKTWYLIDKVRRADKPEA